MEVYTVTPTTLEPKFSGLLDQATLKLVTGDDDITLSIVDFVVAPGGDLYILDNTSGVLRLTYQASGDWIFVGKYATIAGKIPFAIEYANVMSEDGSITPTIAVLYENLIVTTEWPEGDEPIT